MRPPNWDGFPQRLTRSLDRWAGGGQRRFSSALAEHVKGTHLPTSPGTIQNYLTGRTTPSEAWVIAAAEVLGADVDYLLSGTEPAAEEPQEARLNVRMPGANQKTRKVFMSFMNEHLDVPMLARLHIAQCLDDVYRHQGRENVKADTVRRDADRHFGPVLRASRMAYADVMALEASLAAALWIQTFNPERGTAHSAEEE